jgi:hypothetical protein
MLIVKLGLANAKPNKKPATIQASVTRMIEIILVVLFPIHPGYLYK